jgi:2-keto-4-pentenoate hydratase/2-oxohepta-3-ene-1,7-dioic acid hydratase in catechol pathway
MQYVFGYTIINDVTSRELQKQHGQWVIGKGLDTFCPMGPWLVTADEIKDVTQLELVTAVNGEVRQKASVSDLIFDIPTLISTLSATSTLLPGDIIATGTPVGVGIGFSPPKYLKPGDEVVVSITGLGELKNPIK